MARSRRCKGLTKAGKRCRNRPIDSGRCRLHADDHSKATDVLAAAVNEGAAVALGPNESALLQTLDDLDRDLDLATRQMLRSLAAAVDHGASAALWGQYRRALADLTKDGDDDDDRGLARALDALREAGGASAVGNATKR